MRFLRQLRTQIDTNDKIIHGLTQIKGVGIRFAQAVVEVAGINPEFRVRDISDNDLNRIQEIIMNPVENGIPNWMLNRPRELSSAEDLHLTGNKLDIITKRDIDRICEIKSYKSRKHPLRLRVRGRRTIANKQSLNQSLKLRNLIKKIQSLMEMRTSHEIVMEIKYLSEFVDDEFLDLKKGYIIKAPIEKKLAQRGIRIQYWENFIRFSIYADSS